MSCICVGIAKIDESSEEFKETLLEFVRKSGWGIFFSTYSKLADFRGIYENEVVFDLSDDFLWPNCDKLVGSEMFDADDKVINHFNERMTYLNDVVKHCLYFSDRMELYIGECYPVSKEEFLHYEIHSDKFLDKLIITYKEAALILNPNYPASTWTPTVHFIIKK